MEKNQLPPEPPVENTVAFSWRKATKEERMYTYLQSRQISLQSGLIGHLRGDMDTNGTGFFTTWTGFRDDLKTDSFKEEFDKLINALRFTEGDLKVLGSRTDLSKYCFQHMDAMFNGNCGEEFAFRADTEKYAYIFRLIPRKGEYNLYVFCYRKECLDSRLREAKNGIKFVTPQHQAWFTIKDGDAIYLVSADGKRVSNTCRYVDQTHIEIGGSFYHICEFVEKAQKGQREIVPLRASLPEFCYYAVPGKAEVVLIRKGYREPVETDYSCVGEKEAAEVAARKNKRLGEITPAQKAAMYAGTEMGFDAPEANPENYDERGKLKEGRLKT